MTARASMQGLSGTPGDTSFYWREVGVKDCTSPEEEFDDTRQTAKRTFKVLWANRAEAVKRILGFSKTYIAGGTYIDRWLPEYHPEFPNLVAVHAAPRPVAWRSKNLVATIDGPKPINAFKYALIDVTYESVRYGVLGNDEIDPSDDGLGSKEWQRYLIYEARESAEYLSVPQGNLFWPAGSPSQPIPTSTGKVQCFREMVWTWKQVPLEYPDRTLLRDSEGKVNSDVIEGPPWVLDIDDDTQSVKGELYDAGTLLLLSAQPILRFQPDGRFAWDYIFTIRYDQNGHNYLFDWQTGLYRKPSRTGLMYLDGFTPDGVCKFDETPFAKFFEH